MTRKQFRKWKKQNIENKQKESEVSSERPEWADYEKEEECFETWRSNFLSDLKEAIQHRIMEGPKFIY